MLLALTDAKVRNLKDDPKPHLTLVFSTSANQDNGSQGELCTPPV